MRLELGHMTIIEIEDGKPIMYVGETKKVPLTRLPSAGSGLLPVKNVKAAPTFKKIKYAGAEDD